MQKTARSSYQSGETSMVEGTSLRSTSRERWLMSNPFEEPVGHDGSDGEENVAEDGRSREDTLESDIARLEPTEADLQLAREQVGALLARAHIKKVICVDDDFEGEVDDLVAAC